MIHALFYIPRYQGYLGFPGGHGTDEDIDESHSLWILGDLCQVFVDFVRRPGTVTATPECLDHLLIPRSRH